MHSTTVNNIFAFVLSLTLLVLISAPNVSAAHNGTHHNGTSHNGTSGGGNGTGGGGEGGNGTVSGAFEGASPSMAFVLTSALVGSIYALFI